MAGKGNGGQAGDAPAPAPASPPLGLGGGGAPVAVVVGVHEEVPPQEENAELPAHGAGLGGGVHLPVAVDIVVLEDVPEEQHPAPAGHDAADVGLLEALLPEDEDDAPPAPDQEDAGVINLQLQDLQNKLDAPEPGDATTHQVEGSSIMRELEQVLAPGSSSKNRRTDNNLPPPQGQVAVGVTAGPEANPISLHYMLHPVGGGPGGVLMAAGMGPGVAPNPSAQFPTIPRPPRLGAIELCPGCRTLPAVTNIEGQSMAPPAVLRQHACLCNPCFYGAPARREVDCLVCAQFYALYPWKSRRR